MDDAAQPLTMDVLPEGQREVAEIVGFEKYLELCERFGGDNIYIMKHAELLRPSRNREIVERFDGYNYEELAREYGLTVRTIYALVKPVTRERRGGPISGQISFEEFF
jgi:Mor family transcriptional regulator